MSRQVRIVVQCLICVTLIRYLVLPPCLNLVVKRKLAHINGYHIDFSRAKLHLLRGGYSLEDLVIQKDSQSTHPFLSAERVYFGLLPEDLLHGQLTGVIHVEKPTVRFTSGYTQTSQRNVKDSEWQTVFKNLLSIPLEKLTVTEGAILFENRSASNPAMIEASGINISATNVSQQSSELELPGVALATAEVYGGRLTMEVHFDASLQTPEFDLKAQLLGVDLQSLSSKVLSGEASNPVQSGMLSLQVQASYNNSRIKGFVRPWLEGVHLASKRASAPWDAKAVGAPFSRTQQRIQFETIVEFNSASIWSTVAFTLKNAFERGIKPIVKQEISELRFKRREPQQARPKKSLVEKAA